MAQSLEDVVAAVVIARFAHSIVDHVSVAPDVDSDGEPILRVMVVFADDISELDMRELAGIVRHVRPALLEHQETAFPIFRFLTKRDWNRLRHEAA
jgi:hypothetical protein